MLKFSFQNIKIIPLTYIAFVLCTTGLPLYLGGYYFMKETIPMYFVPQNSRLSFIKFIDNSSDRREALYKCDCGTIKQIRTYYVKMGITKSCGCIVKKTNNIRNHPLYSTYRGIKRRCYGKNNHSYKYYGGNNVIMCEEWRSDYAAFYNWAIANGWEKGLHIDKDIKWKEKYGISPGKLYSPEFCQFVTAKENNRNTGRAFTLNKVKEIKQLYATKKITHKKMAQMYNVSISAIRHLIVGINWSDVTI